MPVSEGTGPVEDERQSPHQRRFPGGGGAVMGGLAGQKGLLPFGTLLVGRWQAETSGALYSFWCRPIQGACPGTHFVVSPGVSSPGSCGSGSCLRGGSLTGCVSWLSWTWLRQRGPRLVPSVAGRSRASLRPVFFCVWREGVPRFNGFLLCGTIRGRLSRTWSVFLRSGGLSISLYFLPLYFPLFRTLFPL